MHFSTMAAAIVHGRLHPACAETYQPDKVGRGGMAATVPQTPCQTQAVL